MKSKRLAGLIAVMLCVGLLIAVDRPAPEQVVEVSEPVRRARPPSAPPAALPAVAYQPIPDLFAGGDTGQAPVAPPAPERDGDPPEAAFTLLGFKEEGGVRDAYLMRNGEVVLARAGALLEKRYRVLALLPESVHLHDKQTGQKIEIGFGTNE